MCLINGVITPRATGLLYVYASYEVPATPFTMHLFEAETNEFTSFAKKVLKPNDCLRYTINLDNLCAIDYYEVDKINSKFSAYELMGVFLDNNEKVI
jgi:hypothetical protein